MSTEHIDPSTAAELRGFVDEIERSEARIKDENDHKKEIYKRIRDLGLDDKIVKKVVARRRKDPSAVDVEDALLITYEHAINSAAPLSMAAE